MFSRFSTTRDTSKKTADSAEQPPAAETSGQQEHAEPAENSIRRRMLDAKIRLHGRLLDELDLSLLDKATPEELKSSVGALVTDYVRQERLPVNASELAQLVEELIDEMTGLGPIEPLLEDPTISDILINTHRNVYIERYGLLERAPIYFKDEAHLIRILNKIVAAVGRRVDESQPLVDARLSDGSRVNAAIRPVSIDGPLISIRKFAKQGFSLDRLIHVDALRPPIAEFLRAAVASRISVLISGGTGSGKTTMLNAMSESISPRERLITIEDAAELQLQQPHVGRLETRPPSLEGQGEIRQRELVKNALRMRPDRIIIGEVRGDEAFDMLQAMNTGHEGSMTTIHANSSRDALARLEQMVGMAGIPMSQSSIRTQIASAIRLVVQLQRLSDGRRKLVQLSEITGMEGDVVQMQDIFVFRHQGVSADGTVIGRFEASGIRPKCLSELEVRGFNLRDDIFDPRKAL